MTREQRTTARHAAWLIAATLAATAGRAAAADGPTAPLDLSGFEGEVQLVQAERTEVRQPASGWTLAERQGALVLAPAAKPIGVQPFASPCGAPSLLSATTSPAKGRGADNRGRGAKVEIGITPATAVRASDFSGTLQARLRLVAPQIEVGKGKVELAQVDGGSLAVRGSGTLSASEASDKVELAVDGSGSLRVTGGTTDELTATLKGSGAIRHDGIVRHAMLAASGDGAIRIRQVDDPIRIDQAGFASISLDCAEVSCVR